MLEFRKFYKYITIIVRICSLFMLFIFGGKNEKTILLFVFVLLFTSFIYAKGSKEEPEESMMMMAADMNNSPFDLTGLAPAVIPFTSEADAMMLAKEKTVVYFFAASWCPTCKAAYKNIKTDYKMVPADTVIIVVNYDTENQLKNKYGVTHQHTYVTIDSKGTKKKIWSGSSAVDEILAQAKSL